MFFFERKMPSIYLRIEDGINNKTKNTTAQHILPSNPTNTTSKNKLAQFKQKTTFIGFDIIVN